MSHEEQYIRPPSLRAYLDNGGDLTGFALLDSLVEAVVVARRLLPAETNRKQAARNRRFVERWFSRHGGEVPVPATQELLTFAFWKAECLEDPALADRFEEALPADTLGPGAAAGRRPPARPSPRRTGRVAELDLPGLRGELRLLPGGRRHEHR